jgi:antitoxin VapB
VTSNISNPEADALTGKFPEIEGGHFTDAIVVAVLDVIERRRQTETSIETARRLREKYGITLSEEAKRLLPKSVFDEMSNDD